MGTSRETKSNQTDYSLALWCETQVAEIMAEQERHGVNFNKRKAGFLVHELTEKILELDREAVPQLPQMMNKAAEYKKPFLKSGKLAKWPSLYCLEHGLDPATVAAPFSRVWYTPFDMGKTDKIKRILVDYGWKPDEFNTKNLDRDAGVAAKAAGVHKNVMIEEIVDKYIQKNLVEEPSKAWRNMLLRELRYRGPRTVASIKEFLMGQRFLPTSPKLTEDSLVASVSGTVGQLVMKRVQLAHRRSLLQGLIKQVRSDGKLSASANPCATPTFRMRHRVVVNIPAARSVYGKQIRSLFIGDTACSSSNSSSDDRDVCHDRILHRVDAPAIITSSQPAEGTVRAIPFTNRYEVWKGGRWRTDGTLRIYSNGRHWDFVGYDGAGLELRMLAHFLNDPEYTRQILEGDIHAYNQHLAGLPTRDDAKTFIYAFIYGGGDAKLGEIVGGSRNDGAALRAKFLSGLPTLGRLIDGTRSEAERGYLIGLDGRRLTMRKGYDGKPQLHKALNTRLQGAGAVVMKYAMIILDRAIKRENLLAHKVLDMHDEGQFTSHPSHTPQLRKHMDLCVKQAGEFLNLNIPLASDSIVGTNWYHTH